MPYITSNHDGARLFYRDYVPASSPAAFAPQSPPDPGDRKKPVLVLTSAWPFSSKMWDHVLVPLVETYRFRCIAPDRRGYGKSEWSGPDTSKAERIDYDTFASDLVQILDTALGVSSSSSGSPGFIGVGSSLGCGELLMALSASTEARNSCKGLIFVATSLPIPLRTAEKPNGPPREFWDNILSSLRRDKLGWLRTGLPFIFGPDKLSDTEMKRYEHMAEESDPIAIERTVQAFLERDLSDLMKSLHDPEKPLSILILQGDKDSVNPIDEGPELVRRCLPDTEIVVYKDGYHGERDPKLGQSGPKLLTQMRTQVSCKPTERGASKISSDSAKVAPVDAL